MVARSKCSNQRPDTLMQDRNRQLDENLLQRTAGPYIWVNLRRFGCAPAISGLPPDSRHVVERWGSNGQQINRRLGRASSGVRCLRQGALPLGRSLNTDCEAVLSNQPYPSQAWKCMSRISRKSEFPVSCSRIRPKSVRARSGKRARPRQPVLVRSRPSVVGARKQADWPKRLRSKHRRSVLPQSRLQSDRSLL
jgi:hypothetical protein